MEGDRSLCPVSAFCGSESTLKGSGTSPRQGWAIIRSSGGGLVADLGEAALWGHHDPAGLDAVLGLVMAARFYRVADRPRQRERECRAGQHEDAEHPGHGE